MANGLVLIAVSGGEEQLYSSSMACPDCGLDIPKLEPRSFSFNSTYGACPECHGLGSIYDFDPAKVITDWSKPLLDGALGPGGGSQYLARLVELAAQRYKIDLSKPFEELTEKQQKLLLYGPEPRRGSAHRLPRHSRLPARLARRVEVGELSRVDAELHVGDHLPGLPRQAAAAGIAGGQGRLHVHRRVHRAPVGRALDAARGHRVLRTARR